jgi:hypothetical protein
MAKILLVGYVRELIEKKIKYYVAEATMSRWL